MYQIKRTQLIPTDLATCWDFFLTPDNLQVISPEYIRMKVISEIPEKIYEGLMIEYRMKPLFGVPVNWVTEIKTVKDHAFFVDEQRKGPYRIWHHEHHFREVDGGVEMTDLVSYALPLGLIGKMMHGLIVKRKLEDIFNHRHAVVERIFGT